MKRGKNNNKMFFFWGAFLHLCCQFKQPCDMDGDTSVGFQLSTEDVVVAADCACVFARCSAFRSPVKS